MKLNFVRMKLLLYEGIILILFLGNCISQASEPWIVHTNVDTIQKMELNTWNSTILVSDQRAVVNIDFHYDKRLLFWSDQILDRIVRASFDSLENETDLVTSRVDRADTIAVDWIYNHLYWIDVAHEHICVSMLDGTLRTTLINDGLPVPYGLVVHPIIRWLFFSDVSNAKIEKSGLDGSSRQTLVSSSQTTIGRPVGLSIDFPENRIYWIDDMLKVIKSCTFDGTDIRTVAQSAEYMPRVWGLVVYKDWIYYTGFTNNTIYRVDKQTGTNFEAIKKGLNQPVGIKVYSSDNQPTGVNLCETNNADCEHLCLATTQNSFTCACADGFQLKSDGKGCLHIGSETWLTYTNLYTIERMDMTTNVTETIASGTKNPVDLDIHVKKGYVFWTDVLDKTISRSKVTSDSVSNEVETIVTDNVDVPDGIAVDWMYDLIFWTDTGHDHIQMAFLDGSNRKTIIKDDSLDQPRAIVVDPSSGWLFFSEWGVQPRIERSSYDGTNRRIIVNTNIVWPNGMSVDHVGKRLYWIDGSLHKISSCRFDGSDSYIIAESELALPKPFDLVVFGSYVYWSNWQNKTILRVNKYTGLEAKYVAQFLRSPMGIQVFSDSSQPIGTDVCGVSNGGCSHICYPMSAIGTLESTMSGCLCPDYYYLSADNKTCKAVETPENIQIIASHTSAAVSWVFPAATDIIRNTVLRMFNDIGSLLYMRTIFYPESTHLIGFPLQRCKRYVVELSFEYSRNGKSMSAQKWFWATDDIILGNLGSHVTVSMTTAIDRTPYNITFTSMSQILTRNIFRNGEPVDSGQKYTNFIKNGNNIQFRINNFVEEDIGLYAYKTNTVTSDIDGCVFLEEETTILTTPTEELPTTTTTTTLTTLTSTTTSSTTTRTSDSTTRKDILTTERNDEPSNLQNISDDNNIIIIGASLGSAIVILVVGIVLFILLRKCKGRNEHQTDNRASGAFDRMEDEYSYIEDDKTYETLNETDAKTTYNNPSSHYRTDTSPYTNTVFFHRGRSNQEGEARITGTENPVFCLAETFNEDIYLKAVHE